MFKKLLSLLLFTLTPLSGHADLISPVDLINPVDLFDPKRLVPPMRPAEPSPMRIDEPSPIRAAEPMSTDQPSSFTDPTQPPQAPEQVGPDVPANQIKKEEPRLSAIWITAKSRWVTINNIQAQQGDTIAGDITIIEISKNEVTITQNGTTKTLQLLQSPYKIQ